MDDFQCLFKQHTGKDDNDEADFIVDYLDFLVDDDDDDEDDDDDDDGDFVVYPTFVACWGLGKGSTDPILRSLTPAV